MNDTAFVPARPRPIKWGRIVSLLGAASLCVSFFLPHFNIRVSASKGGRNSPVVLDTPVELIGRDMLLPLEESTYFFIVPFIAAALLLPLLAFRASPRVDASKSGGGMLAWAQCVISLAVLVLSLAWMTWTLIAIQSKWPIIRLPYLLYAAPGEGFLVLVLSVISLIRSRLARKAAAALFALWSYYLVFFIYTATIGQPYYFGAWVSLAASGMLTLGAAIDWFQCRPAKETP
jgi:predicted neutral ceramidase superfamily lipid hydrolase